MADETPPEREVKEFFFKQMLKVQICPSPQTQVLDRVNLTAVSNKYGFVFVGYTQGFKVLRTEDLHSVGHRQVSANKVVEQFDYWADVGCVSTPTHLGVSSDDTTLSVCITKAGFVFSQMYDIRAFSVKSQRPAPFLEVKLSSAPGITLSDLAWNPGSDFGSIFAASMSDGSLGLYEVKDTLKVMASLPGSVKVSCLCWSPKGKQLLVGHEDGTLSQLDQQLKEKRKIPSPSVLSGPVKVVDILWQSTYVYVGAYISVNTGDQPKVIVTNFPKNGNPSSVFYDDICYGNSDQRQHGYYFHQLSEWEMFICASANAIDIPVVGKNTQDKSKWEVWILDDAGRADIPMTEETYQVTYPAGWAVDLTAQTDIQISETETHGPSPILIVLSTGGTLIMYHMINKFPEVPRLTKAVVKPNPAEQRQAKAGGAPAPQPAPAALPDAGAAKPQTTGFSAAAAGGFPGFKTPASTATSLFQPVASTATPAALSQKQTMTTTQTPGKAKQASPSPAPVGPSFAFVKPTSSPAGGFGGAAALGQAAAKEGTGFSFAATKPAAQPAAQKSIFGAAPSFAAAQKQPETSKAAFSFTMGGAGKPGPGSFSFSATSGPNPLAASTPIATPKKDETPQVQPTKLTQKPASSPQQPQGLHKLPVSQPAPKAVLQAQTKTPSPPRYPQGSQVTLQGQPKPTTVTVQASANQQPAMTRKPASVTPRASGLESSGEDPFMLAVLEEVVSFEKELRESKARAAQCEINIGTREELYDLKRDTEDLSTFSNDMKETMQSIQSDIYQLRTDNLEALALQEECQMRLASQNEPKLQSLLRARSLDPQSARLMKEIRSHYQYVQSGIREADQKLDIEWEQYMSKKNKNRRMQVPMMENVYKTIHNNHNVIIEQKRSLDKLMSQVKQMRLYESPSYSRDVTSLSASESFMNSTMAGDDAASILEYPSPEKTANLSRSLLLKPSSSPGGTTGRPLSPEKQAKLCSVLKNHPVTHIKPSKPDLSASKILSGDLLRTRDESDSPLRASPSPKTGNLPSPTRNILTGLRHQTLAAVSQQGRLNQVTTTTPATIPPLSSSQIKAPSVVMTTAVQPTSAPAPKPSGFQVSLSNLPGFIAHTKPSVAMPASTSTVQSSQPGASAASTGFKVSLGALQTSTPALSSESGKGSSAQSTTTSSLFGQAQSTITPKPAANSGQKSSLFGDGGGLSFNISGSAATSTPAFSFGKKQEAAGFTFGGLSSSKEPAPQAKDKNDTPIKPASDASDTKPAAKPVRVALFTGKDDTVTTPATTSSESPAATASAKVTSPALLGLLTAKTTAGFSFTTPSSASSFAFGGTKTDANVFTPARKEATSSVKQDEQKVPDASVESTLKEPESKPSQKTGEPSEKTAAPSSGGFQLTGGTSNLSSFSFKASSASTASTSTSIFQTSSSSTPATGSLFGNLGLSTAASKPSSQGAAGFSFASSSLAGQSGFSFGSPSAGATKQGDASAVDPGTISAANYSFSALLAAKDDSTTEEDQAEARAAAEQAGGPGVFGAGSTSKPQDSAVTTSATATTSMVGKSTLFGNTATTTASSTIFGKSTLFDTSKASATTTQGSLFGGAPAVSGPGASSATSTSAVTSSSTFGSTASPFSGTPTSTAGDAPAAPAASKTTLASAGITAGTPVFGASTTANTPTSGTALFGQAATSGGSIFGNTSSTTPSSGPSLFGNTSTTAPSSGQSIFGNTGTTTPTSGQPLFGKTTTSGGQSIFGNTSATTATSGQSIFGNSGATATTSGQSIFGNTNTTTPSSGQSLFGNTNTTTPSSGQSIFGNSTSETVFGTTPAAGGSLFGGTAATTTSGSTAFGQVPPTSGSGAVFGQPTFGQPSFGGGSTSVFNQSAPTSTAESSSSGGAFGSSGGLFSGLGGKPSAEKANKNVFGGTSFGSGAQENSGSIFGGQSNTATFGTVTTSSGSFSGSGAFTGGGGGSVAAAGFGGFGSTPQSPQQSGFGQAPAFGSAGFGTTSPSFGGTPVFGSGGQSNVFGAGASFSSPVGGAAPQGGIFGSGASADGGGGFGSLAAGSGGGGGGGGLFGGGMGQQSDSLSFGSLAGDGSSGGFGNGGNAFGSSAPKGSSFTSYR